jgi:DNA-binding HxlR family transcriptional regulator
MFNIHVFISGNSNYDTFKKTLKHFTLSKIIILKSNGDIPEGAIQAHRSIQDDCNKLDIDFEEAEYEDNNVEAEIVAITDLKRKNPEANFYFNVTGGRKPEALMATMASLWIGGLAYYWPESGSEPLEFPIPRVSVNDLAKNKLHLKILECIINGPRSQSKIKSEIKTLPGTNKDLSPQALSNSIKSLENYGLITKKPVGRETKVEITLSGKIAYSMIIK